MNYQNELNYLQSLLKNFDVNTYIFTSDVDEYPEFDGGLRRQLTNRPLTGKECRKILAVMDDRVIYLNEDEFLCNYVMFRFPEDDDRYFIAGPFLEESMTSASLQEFLESTEIPAEFYQQFEQYYAMIPILPSTILFKLLNPFAEVVWGSKENFSLQFTSYQLSEWKKWAPEEMAEKPESAVVHIRAVEKQYDQENQLMQMVAQGQTSRAVMMVDRQYALENSSPNKVRNQQNYMIVFNTLLRKSAEAGYVPAYHIEKISSKYAQRIEETNSMQDLYRLQKSMVHGYCNLVKNYSMKDYSLLVRKTLTYIDLDLKADLSLKAIAQALNVNASYLSALFKKETETTLTDYVNRKRIDNAIYLLNTTSMQIQTIAEQCGIQDVNYFIKLFKKYTGRTPKEYRRSIHRFQ